MCTLVVVRTLRYRRKHRSVKALRHKKEVLLNSDKNEAKNAQFEYEEECRRVVFEISSYECPLVYRIGLEFALFRTYAIPSNSKLLLETKEFTRNAGQRYDDTDLLIREFTENPFDSDRCNVAIQRMNYIHAQYGGKISNEDMVYVLSVFVLEPIRWLKRWDWRPLSAEECEALYNGWLHIGRRMGIQNIPESLEEFTKWNQDYEQRKMVYAPSNMPITDATIELFLGIAPRFLHSFGRKVAYCFMDERLRRALKYPDPNPSLKSLVTCLLYIRRFLIRYLSLPRPEWLSARRSPVEGDSSMVLCPRFHTYKNTYRDGYKITCLGAAPAGKIWDGSVRGRSPAYT